MWFIDFKSEFLLEEFLAKKQFFHSFLFFIFDKNVFVAFIAYVMCERGQGKFIKVRTTVYLC